jgi:hypothetical protein
MYYVNQALSGQAVLDQQNAQSIAGWWRREMHQWSDNFFDTEYLKQFDTRCMSKQDLAVIREDFRNSLANTASALMIDLKTNYENAAGPLNGGEMVGYMVGKNLTAVFDDLDRRMSESGAL